VEDALAGLVGSIHAESHGVEHRFFGGFNVEEVPALNHTIDLGYIEIAIHET
jgi:hypothetical protein